MKQAYTIIIIVVAAILGFVIAYPQYQKRVVLVGELKFLKASLESSKEYFDSLNKLNKKIKSREELQKIDIALPLEEPVSEVFRFLEKQGKNNGVMISDFGFIIEEPKIAASEGQFQTQQQGSTSGEVVFSEPNFSEMAATQNQDNLSRRAGRNFRLDEVKITFKARGSYQAMKNFTASLENSIRLFKFVSFSIKESEQGGGKEKTSDLLEATISAKVFNYKKINK